MSNEQISGPAKEPEKSFYQRWLDSEGIPVLRDFTVPDVRTVPLSRWERKGGSGVYLNLVGTEEVDDAYLCEIPPGEALHPQRHLFEEMIFILSGRGVTTVWQEGSPKQEFRWHSGTLFSPPLNSWHQHRNVDPKEPARYLAVTNAPVFLNLFHNSDFVFQNPAVFPERFSGEPDYFERPAEFAGGRLWRANVVPDVHTYELIRWERRGASFGSAHFELSGNVMVSHIAELPPGIYAKGHRHGGGAHVTILSGKGYTLMWQEGKPKQRFDWQEGSLIVPPEGWFHQHFNTGKGPMRHLAMRWGGSKGYIGRKYKPDTNIREGGDQINYEDEDPEIRRMFEEELKKEGVPSAMPAVS